MNTVYLRVLSRRLASPTEFRQLLERLGPTFIKIGQFLALRPDIVPQDYCDELMKLFDRVPPFPWSEARASLVKELGDLDVVFDDINPEPLATGSLSQVHLARLPDGTRVAVKILRPAIENRVKTDLRRARMIARLLQMAGVSSFVSPSEVVQELSTWMMQEIDLSHELRNILRLYDLARDSQIEEIPRPFPELSTKRVLTSEYIEGIAFSALVASPSANVAAAALDDMEIDRHMLGRNLLAACLQQIFRYKFFHADLHPGNLIALPDDVIGFVDFGLCDSLDEHVREQQIAYMTALYNRDIDQMFKAARDLLVADDDSDVDMFKAEFYSETSAYLDKIDNRWLSRYAADARERSPIADWMVNIARAARRSGLRFPPKILSMYRALLTAESVARLLGSEATLRNTGKSFFKRLQFDELMRGFDAEQLQSLMLTCLELFRRSPGQLQQIVSDLASGRLGINVNLDESARLRRTNDQRTKLVAVAVLSVAVATLLTARELPNLFGISSAWPLGAVLALLLIMIVSKWRRLR